MEGHGPVVAKLDKHLAALLAGLHQIVPAMEVSAAFKADHILPARREKRVDALRDRRHLRGPERVRISEHALVTEQVRGDLARVASEVEQRLVSRDDRPAGDPCLAVSPQRRAGVFAVPEP